MKRISKILAIMLATMCLSMCFLLFGCAEEQKYTLTVNDRQLLYETLADSFKAGEEVVVKVKITPTKTPLHISIRSLWRRQKAVKTIFICLHLQCPTNLPF